MTQALESLSLNEVKSRLQTLLGREVEVEPARDGQFAAVYIDYNFRGAHHLLADSEDLAYRKLLAYLLGKETQKNGNDDPES